MNRRSFIQTALTITGALAFLPLIAKSEERRRGGGAAAAAGLVLIDPKDSQAKALNYAHEHKDITDKTLQSERSGVKWTDQKCQGCNFYVKEKEGKASGKTAAPCQLLANKAVAATGWCSSWAKKA
ncbi:MAG: high-potential iron-sulfur protein [Moraxellaceae bacterium]|nr:high-potential iron-sulfur protein [Pseudobdellovibrionaceae bacterium]